MATDHVRDWKQSDAPLSLGYVGWLESEREELLRTRPGGRSHRRRDRPSTACLWAGIGGLKVAEYYPVHPLGLFSPFWPIMAVSPALGRLVWHVWASVEDADEDESDDGS